MKKLYVPILFFVGILVTGCASMDRKVKLEQRAEDYARALREGDELLLLNFVHPSQLIPFSRNSRQMKSLNFSNSEVRKIFPDADGKSAVVFMELEYFSNDGSQLISNLRQFRWTYDEKAKAWLLSESTPLGKMN